MSYQNKYLKYLEKYNNTNTMEQYGGDYHRITANYNSAGVIFTDGKHVLTGYQKNSFFSGIGGGREQFDLDAKFTAIREMLEELFGFDEIKILDSSESDINEKIRNLQILESELHAKKLSRNMNNISSYIENLIKEIQKSITKERDLLSLYINRAMIKSNNQKMRQLIDEISRIPIQKFMYHEKYANFIFDFEKTKIILGIIKSSGLVSKYYSKIPDDIFGLISERIMDLKGEVSNLALVPIKNIATLPTNVKKTLEKTLIFDDYFVTDLNKILENADIYDV